MRRSQLYLILALLAVAMVSCDESRLYEKNIDYESNEWYVDSVASFSFEVKDVKSTYNLFANVRNAISYPFANLYIRYYLFDPKGKLIEGKLLRLPLFDKKSGKPYGEGLGDIFDHRFNLIKNYSFKSAGNYKVQIKQYMRQDPLPFIMAVGLRVEKDH